MGEWSGEVVTLHYHSSYCLLLTCILFHYSHDSYENGNEVSERVFTSNHLFTSVTTLLLSHDSYETSNEVSERVFTSNHLFTSVTTLLLSHQLWEW